MDDERLPKQLFYGDVATGSRRQGGHIRRYKYTLKSSLSVLQINPTNWEELALDRPTWKRTVKTGAVIYVANRIAAARANREARKSHPRPSNSNLPLIDTLTPRDRSYAAQNSSMVIPPPPCTATHRHIIFALKFAFPWNGLPPEIRVPDRRKFKRPLDSPHCYRSGADAPDKQFTGES
nr:unnamed protein product [Spirometra erinaceieuropaei]